MRNLSKFALGSILAAALAGTAVAAARATHVMTVPLPDGTVARVQYVGDVPPRVTVVPVERMGAPGIPVGFGMPDFDSIFGDMDRQMAAAMQQIDQMSRQPLASGPAGANLASYGGALPAGTTSYSSVTVSENGRQCSRSTQVIGQGAGKPPKVLTNVSGNCGEAHKPAAPVAPQVPEGPIHQG